MGVLLLSEDDVRRALTMDEALDAVEQGLRALALDEAQNVPRARAQTGHAMLHVLAAAAGPLGAMGVKVYGTDLAEIEKLARRVEAAIRTVPGTTSAFAERVIGGYYLNIDPDRAQLARYGLTIDDVQTMIGVALGAETVPTTVEGRERYTVSLRYPRDLRSDPAAITGKIANVSSASFASSTTRITIVPNSVSVALTSVITVSVTSESSASTSLVIRDSSTPARLRS